MFNKNLSRFQRRSLQLFSSSILVTVGVYAMAHVFFEHYPRTGPIAWLVAITPAIPFLGTILIAIRYLKREQDEFIRSVVLKSLLTGSIGTVASAVISGCLDDFCRFRSVPVISYVDIFLIGSMIAVRVNLWSSR